MRQKPMFVIVERHLFILDISEAWKDYFQNFVLPNDFSFHYIVCVNSLFKESPTGGSTFFL